MSCVDRDGDTIEVGDMVERVDDTEFFCGHVARDGTLYQENTWYRVCIVNDLDGIGIENETHIEWCSAFFKIRKKANPLNTLSGIARKIIWDYNKCRNH